jgi:predicted GIY-YIG superfamily endonuclease
MNGYVYQLLFEKPISESHPAQTYTGWAADLAARIQAHKLGRGARLTQVAKERGIGFEVVRVWRGGRGTERRIKNLKNGRLLAMGKLNVTFATELSQEEIAELLIPF